MLNSGVKCAFGLVIIGVVCHIGLGFITPGAKPCLTVDNCWDCRTDETLCEECYSHYGLNISWLCNPCDDDNCYTCDVRQYICTNCTSPYESDGGECVMEEDDDDDDDDACGEASFLHQATLTVMWTTLAGCLLKRRI